MGSVGNQNPWAPYESFRDCSQGICSIYCPQWCYRIFPPPPPIDLDDESGTTFSPLIIAIIGILASAFLLVSYYTIITKYCRRRSHPNSSTELEANRDQITHDQLQVVTAGLDETLIKSITVCRFKKGDGLIEGTECAVCLNEFQENESLRLLPKCTHAFHLPCIDTWLKTHSNCPLCRSNAAPVSPPRRPPDSGYQASETLNISALEIHRQRDLVLIVEDRDFSNREEVVVSLVDEGPQKESIQDHGPAGNAEIRSNVAGSDEDSIKHFRRSISLGTFSSERHLLIADILKIDEDGDLQGGMHRSQMGIGSSKDSLQGDRSKLNMNSSSREMELGRSPVGMKRSVSTGRFIVTHDKGKNSIIPN